MARTTSVLVGGIIEVDANISLTPFIDVANSLVSEVCDVTDEGGNDVYTATELEYIERWLAAHFYTARDPRAASERAGSVGVSYQSAVNLGFDNSHYGQMAMRLDWNGGLAALNERAKNGRPRVVGVSWLGTDYDTDDDD